MDKEPAYTKLWTRSEADERAVAEGYWFDHRAANHVCDFFEQHLVHTMASKFTSVGDPFLLLDWQRNDLLMPLFGWMRPDGHRRYRVAYIEVPKKNGKSMLCSGIALYLLGPDGEQSAEVYCAAGDRNQATIVYREAAKMAKASPILSSHFQPIDSTKTIVYAAANSFLRALSGEAYSAEGIKTHGLIFDELHVQKNRKLWDSLRYGGAVRSQPMIVSITTAGFDKKSLCREQHDYARGVIDGGLTDHQFFGLIYAADDDDDWTDPAIWRKANPSIGHTFAADEIEAACVEAQNSPVKENSFKRYRLNIWTEQETRWLQMAKWHDCDKVVDAEALKGRECFAGLDLASTVDVAALVLLFPNDDGSYDLLPFFWIPGDTAQKRERNQGVRYATWAKQGYIELTDGDVIDFDFIRNRINELGEVYNIREISIDRWNSSQLQTQLVGDGFEIIQFGQGFKDMSSPTKELERVMLMGKWNHGGNPVMDWMAGNVTVKTDPADNYKPDKERSSEKIDGIVASIMALGRAMIAPAEFRSKYEDEELLVL